MVLLMVCLRNLYKKLKLNYLQNGKERGISSRLSESVTYTDEVS